MSTPVLQIHTKAREDPRRIDHPRHGSGDIA
jgi:hypothetical protein